MIDIWHLCSKVLEYNLAEFLLWSSLECNRINHYSTIATHILIMLQPLCIFACSYYYDNTTIPRDILLGLIIASGIG